MSTPARMKFLSEYKNGFNNFQELEAALNAFYTNIKSNVMFTVIEFKA